MIASAQILEIIESAPILELIASALMLEIMLFLMYLYYNSLNLQQLPIPPFKVKLSLFRWILCLLFTRPHQYPNYSYPGWEQPTVSSLTSRQSHWSSPHALCSPRMAADWRFCRCLISCQSLARTPCSHMILHICFKSPSPLKLSGTPALPSQPLSRHPSCSSWTQPNHLPSLLWHCFKVLVSTHWIGILSYILVI